VRLEIHVRPNASSTAVGGEYDGALIVRVVEPANEGRATDAALRAVAKALGVPRRSVTLVRGTSSKRKLIEIVASDNDRVMMAVERLRGHKSIMPPTDGPVGCPTRAITRVIADENGRL
jgi:uncharacterized protein YggU (UPF0235/DUF167 family)